MELIKITDKIYISPFDDELDRPSLGMILGSHKTLAIDAGHSRNHVQLFYSALEKNQFPLPDMTAITHWHWDHTFGMHAVSGLSICERRTNEKLKEVSKDKEYLDNLFQTNEKIVKEFGDEKTVITLADIVFDEQLDIDLGDIHAHLFHVPSPHTEDCTCILIEEEKVLFVGDCICGEYPTWVIDPVRNDALIQAIQDLDFEIAIGAHWNPFTKERLLDDLIHLRLT